MNMKKHEPAFVLFTDAQYCSHLKGHFYTHVQACKKLYAHYANILIRLNGILLFNACKILRAAL